jgi:integrase/recombinase XerD
MGIPKRNATTTFIAALYRPDCRFRKHHHHRQKRVPSVRILPLAGGWLFPGQNPINPLTTRQLRRAFDGAREAAGIDKRVSLHTLRHCFATHLLEQKVDIRVIQVLLGHKKLDTTARYTQVASSTLHAVMSPLEHLKLPPA